MIRGADLLRVQVEAIQDSNSAKLKEKGRESRKGKCAIINKSILIALRIDAVFS